MSSILGIHGNIQGGKGKRTSFSGSSDSLANKKARRNSTGSIGNMNPLHALLAVATESDDAEAEEQEEEGTSTNTSNNSSSSSASLADKSVVVSPSTSPTGVRSALPTGGGSIEQEMATAFATKEETGATKAVPSTLAAAAAAALAVVPNQFMLSGTGGSLPKAQELAARLSAFKEARQRTKLSREWLARAAEGLHAEALLGGLATVTAGVGTGCGRGFAQTMMTQQNTHLHLTLQKLQLQKQEEENLQLKKRLLRLQQHNQQGLHQKQQEDEESSSQRRSLSLDATAGDEGIVGRSAHLLGGPGGFSPPGRRHSTLGIGLKSTSALGADHPGQALLAAASAWERT